MLIFTNRKLEDKTDESAYKRSFNSGAYRLGLATVEHAPMAGLNAGRCNKRMAMLMTPNRCEPCYHCFKGQGSFWVTSVSTTIPLWRASSAVTGSSRCMAWRSLDSPGLRKDAMPDSSDLHGFVAGPDGGGNLKYLTAGNLRTLAFSARSVAATMRRSTGKTRSMRWPVYPVGCDVNGLTCYMTAPDDAES